MLSIMFNHMTGKQSQNPHTFTKDPFKWKEFRNDQEGNWAAVGLTLCHCLAPTSLESVSSVSSEEGKMLSDLPVG